LVAETVPTTVPAGRFSRTANGPFAPGTGGSSTSPTLTARFTVVAWPVASVAVRARV
jgi:hypothetical protein